MSNDAIALLCMLHPVDTTRQARALDLLRKGAREYYRQASAKCTAWTYFTAHPSFQRQLAASSPAVAQLTIGGLEIYSSKSALATQLNDKNFFQHFQETAAKESFWAASEQLVAWYQTAGFAARVGHDVGARPFGKGVCVSVVKVTYPDRAVVEKAVQSLRFYASWVRTDQQDVLSYIIFTRPKAPCDMLIVARFRNGKAMKAYNVEPRHQDILKQLSVTYEPQSFDVTIWREVDDSFVFDTSDETAQEGSQSGIETSKL